MCFVLKFAATPWAKAWQEACGSFTSQISPKNCCLSSKVALQSEPTSAQGLVERRLESFAGGHVAALPRQGEAEVPALAGAATRHDGDVPRLDLRLSSREGGRGVLAACGQWAT